MIVERHYDDATLIGLLGASADAGKDPHLAVCAPCSDTLASYRAIADVLGEDAAWDLRDLRHDPVPETIASLRRVSSALASDEAAAESLVEALMRRQRTEWMSATMSDLQYLSPAVVRALVTASERAIDQSPAESLEICNVATRIAETIAAGEPADGVVSHARGTAWRQFA